MKQNTKNTKKSTKIEKENIINEINEKYERIISGKEKLNLKNCRIIIGGGISLHNRKIDYPSFSFSSYKNCKIGGILRKNKDSVCYNCYMDKIEKKFRLNKAYFRHLTALMIALSDKDKKDIYKQAFKKLILNAVKRTNTPYFRYSVSGDIINLEHLQIINDIAYDLDNIKFWLPSKEYITIAEFLENNKIADNLNIRISLPIINILPINLDDKNITYSSVFEKNKINEIKKDKNNYICGGNCYIGCRTCFSRKIKNVIYLKH